MLRYRLLLLLGALQAGACGSSMLITGTGSGGSGGTGGTGGSSGGTGGTPGSPGSVTFVLDVPPPGAFCDQISCSTSPVQHLSITTAGGDTVNLTQNLCSTTDCNTCVPAACPAVAILCPAPQGFAYTGGTWTWDGSVVASSTCGASHLSCTRRTYASAGHYVAHFCATPGSVVQPDAGLPVCVAAGQTVCTEAAFDLPASSTVTLTLATADAGQL